MGGGARWGQLTGVAAVAGIGFTRDLPVLPASADIADPKD